MPSSARLLRPRPPARGIGAVRAKWPVREQQEARGVLWGNGRLGAVWGEQTTD
jgi:hypothetical protein